MTAQRPIAAQTPAAPEEKSFQCLRDLVMSALVAVPYGISLLGGILRPTNIAWLNGDAAMYYIAWAMFRLGGGLHWPLTYTQALGYPIGASIALVDPVPIVALLLRPFSVILPVNFQYLGLYSLLGLVLQLFFAVRLLRTFFPDRPLVAWIGGLFFLLSPPLTFRIGAHFAAASHWAILAALLLYTRIVSGAYSTRRAVGRAALLTVTTVGINPYIATLVLFVLAAACLTAIVKRHMTLRDGLSGFVTIGVCFVISASALGLIGSTNKEFTAPGYRLFSMNLLAPIDPSPAGSPLLPSQRTFTASQYEGYNYLGAGTLALLILAAFVTLTGRLEVRRSDWVKWAPVAICAVWLAMMALSTLVSIGNHAVIDLDPGQHFTQYLATLRASGRLFWLLYYLLTTFAIVMAVRFLKPRDGIVILAATLALQIYDTGPIRQYARIAMSAGAPPANLISPVWRTLNRDHRNLMVLPPWQCNANDTPGGGDGYRIFGLLAAEQGLTINSYYVNRYRQDAITFQCNTLIDQVSKQGLAAHTAYVVSPRVAKLIASGASGDKHCNSVDGMILCTMSDLAGELPRPSDMPVPTAAAGDGALTAQQAGYFISGWTTLDPGFGLWSTSKEAVLAYHSPVASSKSLRLSLMAVSGKNPVTFTLIHERGRLDGVIPVTKPPKIQLFTVRLPIGAGPEVHKVTILTKQLESPADQGYNADPRPMGVGIHTVAADVCPPSSTITFNPADGPDPGCAIK